MITAFILGILLIPLWAFAPNQILSVAQALFSCSSWCKAPGVLSRRTFQKLSPNSVRAFLPIRLPKRRRAGQLSGLH